MRDRVSIVGASDLHLGHKKCPSEHIIESWRLWTIEHKDTIADADMLVLAGDVFDQLLFLSQTDALNVLRWIRSVFELCSRHNLIFRVLKGTGSHDRNQSKIFSLIADNSDVDYQYMDTLCIEHIDVLDMDVLYIPDEWSPSEEQTLKEVYDLLSSKCMKQVDIGIMHGNFAYQLPDIASIESRDQKVYESIVKYAVIIGHVHIHLVNGKICPPGSFDRINHGEPEPKGGVSVIIDHGEVKISQLVNNNSMSFVSVDITGDYTKDSLSLKEVCSTLRHGSHVRLVCLDDSIHAGSLRSLTRDYPTVKFTKTNKRTKKTPVPTMEKYNTSPINKDNLLKLIKPHLHQETPDNIDVILEILRKIVDTK